MKGQTLHVIFLAAALLLIDLYVLNGLKGASKKWKFLHKKWFTPFYWVASALLLTILLFVVFVKVGMMFRVYLIALFFVVFLFKLCFIPFILIDDIRRLFIRLTGHTRKRTTSEHTTAPNSNAIPRSEFLMKAGLLAGAVPLAALKVTMKSGLYDYHIK